MRGVDHLRWVQTGFRQSWAHVARYSWGAGRPVLHDHDYAEVCLVEAGSLLEHELGGSVTMNVGDLLLIEPQHAHCLTGVGNPDGWQDSGTATGQFINVAFPAVALDDLRRTHHQCPWQGGDAPRRITIDPIRSREISSLMDTLAASPGERLDLDCFLLALTRLLRDQPSEVSSRKVPQWLLEALHRFESDPQLLRVGLPALTALSGRSADHLNRSIQETFNENATAFVNRRRIAHAVEMLEKSKQSISEIAASVGMPNLGHFYTWFRRLYGRSPRKFQQERLTMKLR